MDKNGKPIEFVDDHPIGYFKEYAFQNIIPHSNVYERQPLQNMSYQHIVGLESQNHNNNKQTQYIDCNNNDSNNNNNNNVLIKIQSVTNDDNDIQTQRKYVAKMREECNKNDILKQRKQKKQLRIQQSQQMQQQNDFENTETASNDMNHWLYDSNVKDKIVRTNHQKSQNKQTNENLSNDLTNLLARHVK